MSTGRPGFFWVYKKAGRRDRLLLQTFSTRWFQLIVSSFWFQKKTNNFLKNNRMLFSLKYELIMIFFCINLMYLILYMKSRQWHKKSLLTFYRLEVLRTKFMIRMLASVKSNVINSHCKKLSLKAIREATFLSPKIHSIYTNTYGLLFYKLAFVPATWKKSCFILSCHTV